MRYEYAVSVYVFNHDMTAILMVQRRKAPFVGMWVPPGGHVEDGETPVRCARREVMEETGLDIRVVDFQTGTPLVLDEQTVRLPSPVHVQVEHIDGDHRHVDFVFVGELAGEKDTIPSALSDHARWITVTDLDGLDMPRNVRETANYLFRCRREE